MWFWIIFIWYMRTFLTPSVTSSPLLCLAKCGLLDSVTERSAEAYQNRGCMFFEEYARSASATDRFWLRLIWIILKEWKFCVGYDYCLLLNEVFLCFFFFFFFFKFYYVVLVHDLRDVYQVDERADFDSIKKRYRQLGMLIRSTLVMLCYSCLKCEISLQGG